MKFAVFFVLALAVAAVSSLPAVQLDEDLESGVPLHEIEPAMQESGLRYKRATCDGGSFQSKWVAPIHSRCAAHCLTKRYKGGYCKNSICHCMDKF